MPRQNNGQEVFKYVTKISVLRIKSAAPGDSLTTTAIAKAAATVDVAAAANFAEGEFAFVIGSGGTDLVKLAAPADPALPFALKALFPQDIGARIVSATESNLGHISEGGFTFGGTLTLNPVKAATARTPIAYVSETGEMTVGFSLLGHNNLNLAMAFGATEDEIGDGSAADPHAIGIGQDTMGSQGLQAIRLQGVRHDGKIVDLFAIDAQVSVNVTATLGSGQQAGLPVSMKITNLVQRIYS